MLGMNCEPHWSVPFLRSALAVLLFRYDGKLTVSIFGRPGCQ
jgi:hypothetical protein